MHTRRIRYPVARNRAIQAKFPGKVSPPYMLELLDLQWGRLYAYPGSKLADDDRFVRYRFFKYYRPRTGRTGWDMDRARFFVSGSRRQRRKCNARPIEWWHVDI